MGDFPLPHLFQPVVQLLFGGYFAAVVVCGWWTLFQPDIVMTVHVPDLSSSHPSMTSHSLEDSSFADEGFGHPEVALELDVMLVHGHLLCLHDSVLHVFGTLLQCETELLNRLVHRHPADQTGHIPQLLWAVLNVRFGVADVLEKSQGLR